MKTNADNLMCEYSDNVVAYLYDELPAREASIFEAHLGHCTTCTDEFAAVADTRFSVYEWHKEEFVPLATPRFVVPAEPVRTSVWAQIGELFASARPSLAFAGGLAVLAIAVIAGFLALRPTGTEVASNVAVPQQNSPESKPAAPPIDRPVTVDAPAAPFHTVPVKGRPVAKPSQGARKAIVRQIEPVPASGLRQARKVPVLSQDIEIEDESLRLADMFDEVGG
jgi:anti-sigma factor RsiW